MLNFGYGKDNGRYAKESGDFAQQAAEEAINAAQDVENAKNGALNATESANTAAANADEAAGNADNKVAELATYDERVEDIETELVDVRQSTVKGTTFPKLDDRLEEQEADTYIPMKNLTGNTDAGIGLSVWWFGTGITDLTYNPNEKTLEFTGSGAISNSSINWVHYKVIAAAPALSQVYYSAATAKRVSGLGRAYVGVGYSHSSYELTESFSRISYRGTISSTTGRENFVMGADVGVKIAFKDPVFLNLTEIFGAGNEPAKAQMDALLATYPNSWFDGTVNLAENKRIIPFLLKRLELKADKAQEAWVTPTLTNGATGDLQYRKNQFGRVEFRGKVNVVALGQPIFNIPVGYRLGYDGQVPIKTSSGVGLMRFISTYCYLSNGTLSEIDFSGVSYVANA